MGTNEYARHDREHTYDSHNLPKLCFRLAYAHERLCAGIGDSVCLQLLGRDEGGRRGDNEVQELLVRQIQERAGGDTAVPYNNRDGIHHHGELRRR